MSKYDDLVSKLKEIFQIDKPQLDFGVYRILNARADEINDYLEKRLKAKVVESLATAGTANVEHVQKELKEKEAQYRADGIDPDTVPKIKELRQKLAEYTVGSAEHENAVFSHLLTFFSRYYDNGDFISQRRYKGDTYAIPYAGEEVMLHWANKDQYYTKSGENFSNYSFKLPEENGKPGRSVHFKLVAADTAKDNRKDNDKERRFVLIEQQTVTRLDDEGEEYEEELQPIAEVNGELVLSFEYKAMPKGSKQDALVTKAIGAVFKNETVKQRWLALMERAPTESNPQRTVLEKCLTDYTAKNTADYFIHKDLGRFLRGELDFYIKNEVMHLDDVQHAEKFADIEKNLRMIQCLRSIALDLIAFLSQLEDFQKKLWLKKKFVVSAHYCLTLDRVPASLYPAIAKNPRQWEQWEKLGMLEGNKDDLFKQAKAGTVDYLQAHPYLMVDSALFDEAFKAALLNSIENLDESVDGLLIHGDNFGGLQVISECYRNRITCIAIDPPYNTGDDGFCYKDRYKESSWLAQQAQLLPLSITMLCDDGSYFAFCDENEVHYYGALLIDYFGRENLVETLIWNKRVPKNDKGIGNIHDFIYLFCKDQKKRKLLEKTYVMRKDEIEDIYDLVKKLREKGLSLSETQIELKKFYRKQGYDRGITLYCDLNSEYRIWGKINMSWPNSKTEGPRYEVISPVTGEPVPIPKNGWRWKEETFREAEKKGPAYTLPDGSMMVGRVWYSNSNTVQPSSITYLDEVQSFLLRSIISVKSDGALTLEHLGLGGLVDYPKSTLLMERLLASVQEPEGLVLDYFSGSGTTAHAVISLNRQDTGKRKYVLMEQGEYLDFAIKPRIQKVAFSADWKDGKPTTPETGISHTFKVIKLESYEDTLNNLELRRTRKQSDLLQSIPKAAQEDYLLRYMLDVESRGSLLSVDAFKKPFDFSLKVAVDSAGASEVSKIDLVETFNYLIGLRVKHIDTQLERGFVTVIGTLPGGEKTLVLWRDCNVLDYDELNKLCDKLAINPKDSEFEVVYINGDHNIPAVLTTTDAEGSITRTLKLRQIEPEFLSRMFDVEGV
jgi:adenine-specific DNA-methyltransferase